MPRPLDVDALVSLVVARFGEGSNEWWALERGLASERPQRDGLTGAWGPLALRRGHLLRLSEALEPSALRSVHVVAADVRGLIRMNDYYGFAETDAALVRIAQALAVRFPDRTLVRVHGDAFAAMRTEASISAATLRLGDDERRASSAVLVEALRGPAQLAHAPDQVTVVEIELEVEGAHDLELLGHLTYTEIEAALRDRTSRRRRRDLR